MDEQSNFFFLSQHLSLALVSPTEGVGMTTMNSNIHEDKPVIEYPCRWLYKIIGSEAREIEVAVQQIMGETEHTLDLSHTSRTGKYVSFNLEVTVASEEARNFYFAALRHHASITMVL